ncbi:MAG: Acyl-[acyl-carrier-protein]--UDP-N-acetylglucosamine O-acyltransferase [Ignavibacteriae bacterium]|nr:MAG: Acyl-[acyl-carrier-protein]--UDP-N-acetylglucosamine O-acyltransferase [Ignavibacteriota bacterium]
MSINIHPTAVVSSNATISENVTIGPFTVVEDDVFIGEGTQIGSSALLANGTRVGKNCRISHGAVLGTLPQDLKFGGEVTTLEVGDNTTIREYATLNRGTKAHMKTIVGSNCFLMAYIHVAHDCIIGNNVIIANAVNMAGHVEIEDNVVIGGLTAIHQFVRIGKHAMVGGGLRASKDIPPYILAGNDPMSFEGTNIIGLKRRNFSSETISNIENAYRIIYESGLNVSQAVDKIKKELPMTPEVMDILNFISKSKRGIIGRRR